MTPPFCPGYPAPYDSLVAEAPGGQIYPPTAFRTEWGPIFHRGRLDGTATVLIIGQDPAEHEAVARRILIGVAGQRAQGLLTRLGITVSYTMVNTFLYSVYGQSGGEQHQHDPAISSYRNQWLDTIAAGNPLQAIITLGTLAADAYTTWAATPAGKGCPAYHAAILHPTYPESASAAGTITLAAATQRLLANWNAALPGLHSAIAHPDQPPNTAPYGTTFAPTDLTTIPQADLPPGLPAWMRSLEPWASRQGATADQKRATITIVIPPDQRPWTPSGG
jgi:uracil-DNA glycosylase